MLLNKVLGGLVGGAGVGASGGQRQTARPLARSPPPLPQPSALAAPATNRKPIAPCHPARPRCRVCVPLRLQAIRSLQPDHPPPCRPGAALAPRRPTADSVHRHSPFESADGSAACSCRLPGRWRRTRTVPTPCWTAWKYWGECRDALCGRDGTATQRRRQHAAREALRAAAAHRRLRHVCSRAACAPHPTTFYWYLTGRREHQAARGKGRRRANPRGAPGGRGRPGAAPPPVPRRAAGTRRLQARDPTPHCHKSPAVYCHAHNAQDLLLLLS